MNRVELKNAAKEQIKGNIGMLFLCYLVISLLSGVGSIFLSAPLTVGLLAAYLRMTNGENRKWEDYLIRFPIMARL